MSHPTNPKYIVLAGGLTGGPVSPLVAVAEYWKTKDERITPVIFDVKNSFGQDLAQHSGMSFCRIITGKFRRYVTIKNLLTPILILIGFFQSLYYLKKFKPKLVLGGGGFVQIPVMYAAWLLRIPRAIHQQDVLVTLSNRLCTPIANLITTTFESSIRDFPQGTGLGKKYISGTKVYWTGHPVRSFAKGKHATLPKHLKLSGELPVLFVFGGASGANPLNQLVLGSISQLTKVVEIIHLTGPNKLSQKAQPKYHPMESSNNMSALYESADIVLGRAGINTLAELSEFGKPSIIVPMPQTHQELNAELLFKTKAALVLDQTTLTAESLIKAIRKILFDIELQKSYVANLRKLFKPNATKEIVALIEANLLHKHGK